VIFDGLAHKELEAFRGRHDPATLFQHVAKHAVGNRLAVDQHAIAIK
jgi:hypothetical protein